MAWCHSGSFRGVPKPSLRGVVELIAAAALACTPPGEAVAPAPNTPCAARLKDEAAKARASRARRADGAGRGLQVAVGEASRVGDPKPPLGSGLSSGGGTGAGAGGAGAAGLGAGLPLNMGGGGGAREGVAAAGLALRGEGSACSGREEVEARSAAAPGAAPSAERAAADRGVSMPADQAGRGGIECQSS